MVKMEIELTDEQIEKVEILNKNGIDIGQAIDMLFEFKNEVENQSDNYLNTLIEDANNQKMALEQQITQLDEGISVIEKLKESTLDVGEKQKILENDYGESEKSYEMKVQDAKHKISWARDFFKF